MSYEWITPKTDWDRDTYFRYVDYNRIKNNINYLNEQFNNKYPSVAVQINLGEDADYFTHYKPSVFNAFEDAIENFKRIDKDCSIGKRNYYFDNQPFIGFIDLNRIEKTLLRYYNYDMSTEGWITQNDLSFYPCPKGATVYDNKIYVAAYMYYVYHRSYYYYNSLTLFSWDGSGWQAVWSTTPSGSYYDAKAEVILVPFSDGVHWLQGSGHYLYDGNTLSRVDSGGTDFKTAVTFDNKIYIIDGLGRFFTWDGTRTTFLSTVPYEYQNVKYSSQLVVYDNEVHLFYSKINSISNSVYKVQITNLHYIWRDNEWVFGSELPYDEHSGMCIYYQNREPSNISYSLSIYPILAYEGKIHILGGVKYEQEDTIYQPRFNPKQYSWDGVKWEEESVMPYDVGSGWAVAYGQNVHTFGGNFPDNMKKHSMIYLA